MVKPRVTSNKSGTEDNKKPSLAERMQSGSGAPKLVSTASQNKHSSTPMVPKTPDEEKPKDNDPNTSIIRGARRVSSEDDEHTQSDLDLSKIIPKTAQGKRVLSEITGQVDKWDVPEEFGKIQEKQFKNAAIKIRYMEKVALHAVHQVGYELMQLQTLCESGQWQKFLKEALGMNVRIAEQRIQVAKSFPDMKQIAHLSGKQALFLTNKNNPQSVKDEILKTKSHEEANDIIKRHRKVTAIKEKFGSDKDPFTFLGEDLAMSFAKTPDALFRAAMNKQSKDESQKLLDDYQTYRTEQNMPKDRAASFAITGNESSGLVQNFVGSLSERMKSLKAISSKVASDNSRTLEKEILEKIDAYINSNQ